MSQTDTETPDLVRAATTWATNAHVIEDAVRMRYLRPGWNTLDPTYGKGTWWKRWRPDRLVATDLNPARSPDCPDGIDFQRMPWPDRAFGQAVFDPPYVTPGGRETSTIKGMHDAYGMDTTERTPAAQQDVNNRGLAELRRVVRPGGMVLTKCADYVWSGKLVLGTHHTLTAALGLGFEVIDRWEHLSVGGRPQPENRTRRYCVFCDETVPRKAIRCQACRSTDLADGPVRQRHARRNLSTLLILQVPKR